MTRPARVVIDLNALRHNLSRVRQLAPASRIMAVVKADAYGHGLVRVASSLAAADAFGVACMEEAQELRAAGIQHKIVLLEGFYSADGLALARTLGLEMVIHHTYQLEILEQAPPSPTINVWLKIDSGMHRLGFQPGMVAAAWRRLRECPAVGEIRLMTHFAAASERDNPMTREQLQVFNSVCIDLQGERSLANSAALIAWPQTHADWVRPGLMLYGVSPMDDGTAADHDLKPVMSLESELISVKALKQGDTVGYGATWSCPEDMSVGIVATGYGDGFPRHAKTGTPIMVRDIQTMIIGNTSMDMLAVDLRRIPEARTGDSVELWGPQLPVESIARHAGTIPYEILCAVHKRLRFMEKHDNGEG